MATFGKRSGGARRIARREEIGTTAVVATVQKSRPAVLVDLSNEGARLRGTEVPAAGQTVSLMIEGLRLFGVVAWSRAPECGLSFDAPLPLAEVERMKQKVAFSAGGGETVEVKLAFEDWNSGLAR